MATKTNETNTMFDTWVNAQKDLVNKWQESTKKVQDSMVHNDAFTKGGEVINKWMNKQTEAVKNATQNTEAKTESPKDMISNMFKMQTEWMKGFSQTNMELSKEFANIYKESNNKTKENFNTSNMFQGTGMDNWMNIWKEMSQSFTKTFDNNEKANSWSNMMNSAELYMKAFDFWMPIYKAFQNKELDKNTFKNFFSMDSYKEMMDKFVAFAPGNNTTGFPNNMEDWTNQMKEQTGKFNRMFLDNLKSTTGMPMIDANPVFTQMLDWNKTFNEQMDMFSSPFIKMMSPGKEKQQLLQGKETSENLMNWQVRQGQMQFMITATSIKAVERFSHLLIEKADKGESIDSFVKFYSLWLNTNDATFVELFRSPEYSKVQSDFTSYGMKLKKTVEQQMEAGLSNIPVVTRSEMDELYQTVYALNKKVKGLEKELKTAEAKVATTTKTTTAPKTTATKTTATKTTAAAKKTTAATK